MKRFITKPLTGLVLGFLAVALVAGLAFAGLGQSAANASAAANTNSQASTGTNTGSSSVVSDTVTPAATTTPANNKSQYSEAFRKAFAQALGVDESKLDPAFTSAVNSVADQAVKDGKLTQAQADAIKARAKNGFQGGPGFDIGSGKGEFGRGFGPGKGFGGAAMGQFQNYFQQVFDSAASTIGITKDQLKTELQGGKSVAQVAQAHNVDLAKVKTTVLANIKTQLDKAVKDGKLTQAQADQANTMVTNNIDQILNNPMGGHHFGKK